MIEASGLAPEGDARPERSFLALAFSGPFLVRNALHLMRGRNPSRGQAVRIPEHPTQIRAMLDARRARLAPDSPVLAGTLSQVKKRCGQPTCHCYRGEPHLAWHLSYKVKGKSRTVYVPLDLLDDVRTWIAEHKRIKTLQAEIHQLSVALIRTHTTHKRQKAGRR